MRDGYSLEVRYVYRGRGDENESEFVHFESGVSKPF